MSKSLTTDECKKILFRLGIEFGVPPALISTRMLNAQDKCDMLNGDLTIVELRQSVKVWRDAGMPDTANGNSIPYVPKKGLNRLPTVQPEQPLDVKCHYRKPFVCPDWRTDCHCRAVEIAE